MAHTQARDSLAVAHLAALVESSDDAILSQTLDSIVTSWNAAAERLYGYSAAEMIGQPKDRIVPMDRRHEEQAILDKIRAGQRVKHFETVRVRRDGARISLSISISPIVDSTGRIVGAAKIARDVSAEHAERERLIRLSTKAQHFAAMVESCDDAIVSKSVDGRVTSWNRGADRIFGYSSDEMIGRSIRVLLPPDRQGEEDDILRRVNAGEQVGHFETQRLRRDGTLVHVSVTISPIRDEQGRIVGISKIGRDIGERLEAERRIVHEATHDSLTGLPNRRLLKDAMAEVLQLAQAQGSGFAVLYIDLDGFKAVNDQLGHDAGDQLLVDVARRMKEVVRPGDLVARMGGDEFVVLAPRIQRPAEAIRLGVRLVAMLRISFSKGFPAVSASIGVAFYPAHGRTYDDLLRHADQALYEAKRAGRNRLVVSRSGP